MTLRGQKSKVEVEVWVNLEVHFQNGIWSKGGGGLKKEFKSSHYINNRQPITGSLSKVLSRLAVEEIRLNLT